MKENNSMSLLAICSEGRCSLPPAYSNWVWYLVVASSIVLILTIMETFTDTNEKIKNTISKLLGIFKR